MSKDITAEFNQALLFCASNKDLSASYASVNSVLSSLNAEAAAQSITLTKASSTPGDQVASSVDPNATSTTDFLQGPTLLTVTATFSMLP